MGINLKFDVLLVRWMQIDYSILVKGVNKFVFGKMLANINNLGMKDISKIIARTLLKVADDDEREELSRWKGIKKENENFLNNFQTFMEMPQNIEIIQKYQKIIASVCCTE